MTVSFLASPVIVGVSVSWSAIISIRQHSCQHLCQSSPTPLLGAPSSPPLGQAGVPPHPLHPSHHQPHHAHHHHHAHPAQHQHGESHCSMALGRCLLSQHESQGSAPVLCSSLAHRLTVVVLCSSVYNCTVVLYSCTVCTACMVRVTARQSDTGKQVTRQGTRRTGSRPARCRTAGRRATLVLPPVIVNCHCHLLPQQHQLSSQLLHAALPPGVQ